jgi:hypothetical protein
MGADPGDPPSSMLPPDVPNTNPPKPATEPKDAGDDSSIADVGVPTDEVFPDGGGDEFGAPCSSNCRYGVCYIPGTQENPICSKHCTTDADCGSEGICQTSDINAQKWCFRRCTDAAECLAINDDTSNPLQCALQLDPDNNEGYGGPLNRPLADGEQAFCVQASEP